MSKDFEEDDPLLTIFARSYKDLVADLEAELDLGAGATLAAANTEHARLTTEIAAELDLRAGADSILGQQHSSSSENNAQSSEDASLGFSAGQSPESRSYPSLPLQLTRTRDMAELIDNAIALYLLIEDDHEVNTHRAVLQKSWTKISTGMSRVAFESALDQMQSVVEDILFLSQNSDYVRAADAVLGGVSALRAKTSIDAVALVPTQVGFVLVQIDQLFLQLHGTVDLYDDWLSSSAVLRQSELIRRDLLALWRVLEHETPQPAVAVRLSEEVAQGMARAFGPIYATEGARRLSHAVKRLFDPSRDEASVPSSRQ